ncbi:thiamine diphosphokinase [Vagococcus fluvialis]|uniref:thiamine diphosphokinase n=1 Tax=Vagococcus fluvialis TaxID=2738 RepID=UPI0020338FB7|nr:thiamine diphosphokinase [Vagococcus fluvialis]MCM2139357.1 thiamine diphosphokinase [Vagococcus fluvialis]
MIKDVVIIGGAPPSTWPEMSQFKIEETAFIGVDRGSLYGVKAGLPIMEAVGDFDSLSETEWIWLEKNITNISRCAAEKDDTDMELGVLKAIEKYPKANYYLIGATGGRLDHYLGNIWLPLQERFLPILERLSILDNQNSIVYYLPGEYEIIKEADKDYLAYICLTPVRKLSLFDAKYQLDRVDFLYPRSLSSNEFVGETSRFAFEDGILATIQSKDLKKEKESREIL